MKKIYYFRSTVGIQSWLFIRLNEYLYLFSGFCDKTPGMLNILVFLMYWCIYLNKIISACSFFDRIVLVHTPYTENAFYICIEFHYKLKSRLLCTYIWFLKVVRHVTLTLYWFIDKRYWSILDKIKRGTKNDQILEIGDID